MATGYQLPVKPETGGRKTEGFMTPTADKMGQKVSVPPKRVLPIIFLPGIMGSNLRLTAASGRQREMGRANNISWRPDNLGFTSLLGEVKRTANATPTERQRLYDPNATEVDTYDPVANPTGNANETADQRHGNAKVDFDLHFDVSITTPLLMDDPKTMKNPRTKAQKARARGWGEVLFGSYGELLQMCELRLNTAFFGGQLDGWWMRVIGVKPQRWQRQQPHNVLDPHPPQAPNAQLKPLTSDELMQAVKGCWFPMHAMGYNWLQSNEDSGKAVAKRIVQLMADYTKAGFDCEKVIVVTHSMGGLVARALIHPDMGNLNDKVLGVIHGVMPAIGAGAAYKRIRCGFEGFGPEAAVPGNFGNEVTAVLGNAQGGLELLPSQAYGNEWLQVHHKGETLKSLPKNGDPYEEIYKVRGKWYGLLREEWLNPAGDAEGGYGRTAGYLDKAKAFHNAITNTYHDCSYAHYGADPMRPAWQRVVWEIDAKAVVPNVETLTISTDDMQGKLSLFGESAYTHGPGRSMGSTIHTSLLPPREPGDQTVPQWSADHQLRSGKFQAVFQQEGYEHQKSYGNDSALSSTLYSLVRIIQTMKWSKP